MIFSEIASRFRRACRNRTRLHLDETHVKVLLDAGFYEWVTARENEEMVRSLSSSADGHATGTSKPTAARRDGRPTAELSDSDQELLATAQRSRLNETIEKLKCASRERRRARRQQ